MKNEIMEIGFMKDKGKMYQCQKCGKTFFTISVLRCPCGNTKIAMSDEDKKVYAQLKRRFTLPQIRRLLFYVIFHPEVLQKGEK